jgi:hypothetical protein
LFRLICHPLIIAPISAQRQALLTERLREAFVNDRLLVRRLPVLVQAAGFENLSLLQTSLIESLNPSLSLTWIERGADAQLHAGLIGADLATTLEAGLTVVH